MQNIVINMCEKFHDDQSRNGGAQGDRKSDNNKKNNNKNNVRIALAAWDPFPGPKWLKHTIIFKMDEMGPANNKSQTGCLMLQYRCGIAILSVNIAKQASSTERSADSSRSHPMSSSSISSWPELD